MSLRRILVVLLLSAGSAFATTTGVVYGTVYDGKAHPVAGVQVTLENTVAPYRGTQTTGSDGSYSFTNVVPGNAYRITASVDGKIVDTREGLKIAAGDELIIFPALLTGKMVRVSQNAVVYGTVYDAAHKPAAGVTVKLENPAIAMQRTTHTSADGSYAFAEVPPANGYKLTAIADGRVMDVHENITVNVGDEALIPAIGLKGYRSLSLDELEDALAGEVPPARVTALVNQYGVNFALDDKVEARLRKMGADDKVIIAILKNKK